MPGSESQPTHHGLRATLRSGGGRLLQLCNNWFSALGLFLVGLALMLLLTLATFIVATGGGGSPYIGIFVYLILPTVFVAGLVIVPLGILWQRRRIRRHGAGYGRIDFNDRRTRAAVAVFGGLTFFIVLPVLAVSSYQGYVYTESTDFCARVCHAVMQPEATAHETSAHARVACAECHIGAGASWFVKSKLSGTRQVFAVMFNTYSRPIPSAIQELRPARETCEECHWPAQFFGSQYRQRVHYSSDEHNTRRVLRMLVNTGGADASSGKMQGIHMHMLVAGSIEYVATDEKLQEIPWVRYTGTDGRTTVYRDDGQPVDAPPPAGTRRQIDCMDCHNRGAHHFRPPTESVDTYLEAGWLDASLPFLRREAVAALARTYPDGVSAERLIRAALETYYAEQQPATWAARADAVRQAVTRVQEIYRRTFFPAMNVTWQTYPENVGHMYSAGCFRCHDGLHVDAKGTAITSACDTCHTFLNPVAETPDQYTEGTFQHSMPLDRHPSLRCSQCHDGGNLLRCYDCHQHLATQPTWPEGRLRRMPGQARHLR